MKKCMFSIFNSVICVHYATLLYFFEYIGLDRFFFLEMKEVSIVSKNFNEIGGNEVFSNYTEMCTILIPFIV